MSACGSHPEPVVLYHFPTQTISRLHSSANPQAWDLRMIFNGYRHCRRPSKSFCLISLVGPSSILAYYSAFPWFHLYGVWLGFDFGATTGRACSTEAWNWKNELKNCSKICYVGSQNWSFWVRKWGPEEISIWDSILGSFWGPLGGPGGAQKIITRYKN